MKNTFLFLLLAFVPKLAAQPSNAFPLPETIARISDSIFLKCLGERLTPGGILAVVTPDSILLLKGYGLARVEENQPVDAEETLFQLGSVGKVFTAIAVLQLAEQGKLDLNKDLRSLSYLGKLTKNPFREPVTAARLLTHTAGYDERAIGYMARNNDEVEPLEAHLIRRMPAVYQAPGTEINYSNYSYGLAGLLVEKTAQMPFQDYIGRFILQPLGMSATTYIQPGAATDNSPYASGYRTRDTFLPVTSFPRHALPAGSLLSTGRDMAVFLQWMLKRDTLLGSAGFDGLYQRQFSNHPLLTGYTFGLEEQNINGHYAVAKGGVSHGFLAEMVLFPAAKLGLFVGVNTQTDNVLDSLFAALKEIIPAVDHPDLEAFGGRIAPKRFTGIYRSNRCNHSTVEEMFEVFQSPIEIRAAEKENTLEMILNGWLYTYSAIADTVFRNEEDPRQFLVFSNFKNGKAQSLYTSVEVNGLQLPASFGRLKWYERPRFINDQFPAVVFPLIGAYLLLPLSWLLFWLLGKWKPRFRQIRYLSKTSHALGLAFALMTVWHLAGFFLPVARMQEELLFGLPDAVIRFKYLHWAMAALAVVLFFQTIRIWLKREGWWGIRLFYTLFSLAAVAYALFLWRWHFMSMDF